MPHINARNGIVNGYPSISNWMYAIATRQKFIMKLCAMIEGVVYLIISIYSGCLNLVWLATLPVSYTHLRAHETRHDLVCRLLLEKKKHTRNYNKKRKI